MTAGRDGFIPPYMDLATLCKHICFLTELRAMQREINRTAARVSKLEAS